MLTPECYVSSLQNSPYDDNETVFSDPQQSTRSNDIHCIVSRPYSPSFGYPEWMTAEDTSLEDMLMTDIEMNGSEESDYSGLYDVVSRDNVYDRSKELQGKDLQCRFPWINDPDGLFNFNVLFDLDARAHQSCNTADGSTHRISQEQLAAGLADSVAFGGAVPVESAPNAKERHGSGASSKDEACDIKSEVYDTSSCQASEIDYLSDVSARLRRRTCGVCHKDFSRASELEAHSRDTGHKPFACLLPGCTAQFTRQDALTRHREMHAATTSYPCEECDRYRGQNAFKRRDHLIQHLKKAHRLSVDDLQPKYCPHQDCIYSGLDGRFWGFKSRTERVRHLREAHEEGTHECDVSDCDRKGKKGFARKRDLEIHREKVHTKSE